MPYISENNRSFVGDSISSDNTVEISPELEEKWFTQLQKQKLLMQSDLSVSPIAKRVWEFLCQEIHKKEDLKNFVFNLQVLYRGNEFSTELNLSEEQFLDALRELGQKGYGSFRSEG
jgi:hypothetical protein